MCVLLSFCSMSGNLLTTNHFALPPHCSHVLEVIDDPKPPVRAAGIEALGRAIIGALGSLGPAASGSAAAASAAPGAAAAAASESTGGVEHMLLVALEALYNADNERDVRAGVLRVLLSVLQVGRVARAGRVGRRALLKGSLYALGSASMSCGGCIPGLPALRFYHMCFCARVLA